MKYLLDTNTCIYALKMRPATIAHLREHSPDDLSISIVTVAELWFGARKSVRPGPTRREVDAFLAPFEVLPLDFAACEASSEARLALERSGRPIGERDLLIAAIALAHGLAVVTHNVSEFARVPRLRVEDWA